MGQRLIDANRCNLGRQYAVILMLAESHSKDIDMTWNFPYLDLLLLAADYAGTLLE